MGKRGKQAARSHTTTTNSQGYKKTIAYTKKQIIDYYFENYKEDNTLWYCKKHKCGSKKPKCQDKKSGYGNLNTHLKACVGIDYEDK